MKVVKPDTTWQKVPKAGIVDSGTAQTYKTGGWRTFVPIHDKEKCTNCLICWMHCPDSSILIEDGKIAGFDLEHCKGCGICAKMCPPKIKAIKMEKETDK